MPLLRCVLSVKRDYKIGCFPVRLGQDVVVIKADSAAGPGGGQGRRAVAVTAIVKGDRGIVTALPENKNTGAVDEKEHRPGGEGDRGGVLRAALVGPEVGLRVDAAVALSAQRGRVPRHRLGQGV